MNLQIRRRSGLFPAHPRGGDSPAQQPAQGVHVGESITAFTHFLHAEHNLADFKPDSLLPMMEKLPNGQMQAILGSRLQAIKYDSLYKIPEPEELTVMQFLATAIRSVAGLAFGNMRLHVVRCR